MVSQLAVFISTAFLIDFLIWHDSAAAALFQSVFTAILAFGYWSWLARRRARS